MTPRRIAADPNPPKDPAPVDVLLGDEPTEPSVAPTVEDPPPGPGVTPTPADPVPDSWVLSTSMGAAVGAIIGLVTAVVVEAPPPLDRR